MVSSIRGGAIDARFTGLVEHTLHGSKEELLNGDIDYDFDHPPENPKTYLAMRNRLIEIMTEWVQKNSKG